MFDNSKEFNKVQ